MSKKPETEPAFEAIGNGVEASVTGDMLTIRVPLDAARATPSASGKMLLAGSTGGWKDTPGGNGWRFNVMVGKYANTR